MLKSRGPKYLSELERIRFNVLADCSTVKDAAQKLKIPEGTLYNWLSDLRIRLLKERGHINASLAQMKRSPLLKKELSVRRPIALIEDLEEAEVDEET